MNRSLTTRSAWIGVWIRQRSGPSNRGTRIEVGRWHRIAGIDNHYGDDRFVVGCRSGPWIMMPAGGGRLEVADVTPFGSLPGDVCPRCAAPRPRNAENEVQVEDPLTVDDFLSDPSLDVLVDAIYERMRQRAEDLL